MPETDGYHRMMKPNTSRSCLMLLAFLFAGACCVSCQTQSSATMTGKTLPAAKMKSTAVQERNQLIAVETQGDYYIGRRWFTDGTRYWGYLRRPGELWSQSQLVVIDESLMHQPDRVAENPSDGSPAHGFDHNYEYRLWGNFSGKVYDPNSNLELSTFRLQKYELISANPGFLFYPGEPYNRRQLPPMHPNTL